MSLSDSMFLFEIMLEELETFMLCKDFSIKSEFVDVFTLYLREPRKYLLREGKCPFKRKCKVRDTSAIQNTSSKTRLQTGQSVLLANSVEWLSTQMKKHDLTLSLWSKKYPKKKLGGARIPWSQLFFNYLNKVEKKKEQSPVKVRGTYNLINTSTDKCIAILTLCIKLTHLKDTNTEGIILNPILKNKNPDNIENNNEEINIEESKPLVTIANSNERANDSSNDGRCNTDNKDQVTKSGYLLNVIKSETTIDRIHPKNIFSSQSLSSIDCNEKFNPLTYIFGCPKGPFGSRVYCVNYFTVENDVSGKADSSKTSVKESDKSKWKCHLKLCDSACLQKQENTETCSQSICSLDIPEDVSHLVSLTKCKKMACDNKKHREPPTPPDDRILLDITNLKTKCCNFSEKIEQVVGGVSGKVQIGNDPCFCTCECTFGFTKKTTYCNVCGGYEVIGEEMLPTTGNQMPFPCPIFRNLVDKSKLKNWSTSGSESRKKDDLSLKSMKLGSSQKAAATAKRQTGQTPTKSVESEKDSRKPTVKKNDDRFKFNYGYKGIPPQIGHDDCAMPCTGTLGSVPKKMGWLWTAEDIPGMRFRPMWKPGAINKHVLRLLRMAKNPGEVITARKRRKDASKKKRPLKRPLLIVQKRDGEYTVTMETMKTYAKPRALNQIPYEDKPVLTYTIGRTEEENRDRKKKREREQRRLEREQRHFIQSAFRDMCKDICLKTYQQALGILPGAEDPDCTCFTPSPDKVNMDVSCSCSDEKGSDSSDTDMDEWVVEFTPPVANFDPTFKGKKLVKADAGTQYTYLDYRVKLVDRLGNPVPRFFKGPDGKQQCSDLGGFWDPNGKWLEINVDGFIAPDERWAPNFFTGPNGEMVDAQHGKFQISNGRWLVVGIDGFVDVNGKWRAYPFPRQKGGAATQLLKEKEAAKKGDKKKVGTIKGKKPLKGTKRSEASFSCFGDASPKHLSKMGIMGHGQDKKLLLSVLRQMLASGDKDIKIPKPSTVYRLPESKRSKRARFATQAKQFFEERYKCRHPVPSERGIIATDAQGNKTYFKLTNARNRRPKERLADLAHQGISVSSFHVPCFHSFINSEIMKKQQRERLMALAAKSIGTQAE